MPWPDDDTADVLPERLIDGFGRAARARVDSFEELRELLEVDEASARELFADWARAGLATAEGDGFRLQNPDTAIPQFLTEWSTRLRRDLAGLGQLVASSGVLARAWRESFENDAIDYTVDRIDDDGRAWFAWWSYLAEREGAESFAIVSNLDALHTMEAAAPGHIERLLGMLERGRTMLNLLVPPQARVGAPAVLMTRLVEAGAAVRVGDTSGWFAVTSGSVALIPAVWGQDRAVAALLLREPSIVAGLEELFRLRWRDATPWEHREAQAAADPIIESLCLGRTDGEVAEIFGISVRSVRRRVAAAIAATGASSRMELGHRLGSRVRSSLPSH